MAGTKIEKIYEPLKAKKINIKRWTGDISLNVSLSILEKSEYAVTANDLKNKSDIPILLFLACTGYQ